ncbi:hypothetical protein Ahy_B09g097999 isoform B [Arachis hypogaea]|uniref:Uncharacterized protein n=1 Tax=Arachis hypogaea TaxID=3818 RepID=A0A444XQH3_ARAHY|nr:hypothetical protein Ahy_B09g097999 isoform B [Arachis hypogaea]
MLWLRNSKLPED